MNQLLLDLARLSGLRDREAMDFSLVKLLLRCPMWSVSAVRLVRAAGPMGDQRWLTLAQLQDPNAEPTRDHVWLDLSHLPALSACPHREDAIVTESVVCHGHGPMTTLFPIDTQASVCSLLEVESAQALAPGVQDMFDSVLHLYENLQSLLDYGEKDSLTELLNRKTFDGAFQRAAQTQIPSDKVVELERRAAVSPGSFWLAVIDIDHFKHVNDNYGHLIGDEVLLLLARLMRSCFRYADLLYRFGGEEFVVLMRAAHHTDAESALNRFRLQVLAHDFPQVGHISVSVGFTPLRENDTPSGAFDRADKAVYYAKGHGRNQVCSYTQLVEQGELVAQVDTSQEVDFF